MIRFKQLNAMQYFFTEEDGRKTEVDLERWAWVVMYPDGSELHQFGPDGVFHRIGEVDQARIIRAYLVKTSDPTQKIFLPWEPGMRLVHKYRNLINFENFVESGRVRVYIFGFKHYNEQMFIYVLPNDQVVVSGNENLDLSLYL